MEINKDSKNDLLSRREMVVTIKGESNPGFSGVTEELTKKLKIDKERIAIKKIESGFGKREFVVDVLVYDSKNAKESVEKENTKKESKKKDASKEAKIGVVA